MLSDWSWNSWRRLLDGHFLARDEYWEFKARTYSGRIKAKIRFRLEPDGEEKKAAPIFSNDIEGQLDEAQLR